jgi:hypothetical protein
VRRRSLQAGPWSTAARLVVRADRGPAAPAKADVTMSHESIYRFIYAQVRRTNDGAWRHYLPKGRSRRSAPNRRRHSDLIKGRVSIDRRPPGVDERGTFDTGKPTYGVRRPRPGRTSANPASSSPAASSARPRSR